MRILLVEDDKMLGKAIHTGLRQEYAADWFQNAEDGEEALAGTAYDVLILDVNLPGMSGIELLQRLRRSSTPIPVLLLTARDTISQRVEGLDAGADDYLVKPFDFEELMARIRALGRRRGVLQEALLCRKNLSLDAAGKTVMLDGNQISLSQKEFSILLTLMENMGRVLSKEQIESRLYGWDDEIESNTVEVHVSAIRRKLGKDLIRTIRGVGYMIEPQ